MTFPIELRGDEDAAANEQLNPLVAAGLISVTRILKHELTGQAVDYLRYAPTAGQNAIRKGANGFLGGSDICFAKRRIGKIETFTTPADALGMKVTRVTYSYELKDIALWCRKPDIAQAFPQIGAMLATTADQATDGLVLMDSGWKPENDTP